MTRYRYMANFLHTLALPAEIENWSLTTLQEKVVKIGAKVIARTRYSVFQMVEVAVPRELFQRILEMIDALRDREICRDADGGENDHDRPTDGEACPASC